MFLTIYELSFRLFGLKLSTRSQTSDSKLIGSFLAFRSKAIRLGHILLHFVFSPKLSE